MNSTHKSNGVLLQTVLDAIRARKGHFVFENIEMRLQPTVMAFITMNPGYPGRAELPESLKVRCLPAAHCPEPPCTHVKQIWL